MSEQKADKALQDVMRKLQQFAAQGCNGNVTVHFAAGVPRKIDYNSTEAIAAG